MPRTQVYFGLSAVVLLLITLLAAIFAYQLIQNLGPDLTLQTVFTAIIALNVLIILLYVVAGSRR